MCGGGILFQKSLNFSDFVFIESLSIIVQIKITFSNLKSVECFEIDKKFLETMYTNVKKGILIISYQRKKTE